MSIFAQVTDQMQEVLNIKANEVTGNSGFIQRQRKFTGSAFVQTLVFGWLQNPETSYADLAQTARALDIDVSRQAIVNKMTDKTSTTLKAILESAATECVVPHRSNSRFSKSFRTSMCKKALGSRSLTNSVLYEKALVVEHVEQVIKKLP